MFSGTEARPYVVPAGRGTGGVTGDPGGVTGDPVGGTLARPTGK